MQDSPTPKPRILCLHGGGTSATVFAIQTIRLRRLLPNFEFIFLSGPFESGPGPGVLPYFEGMDPYFRWRRASRGARVPMTEEDLEEVEEDDAVVDGFLDDVLSGVKEGLSAEQILGVRNLDGKEREASWDFWSGYGKDAEDGVEGVKGPFIGVLGFSQGAGVAARLLLRQDEMRRMKASGGGQKSTQRHIPLLKFGVLIGGSPQCLYSKARPPPKSLAGSDLSQITLVQDGDEDGYVNGERETRESRDPDCGRTDLAPKITIPTIHVHGLSDQYLSNGRMLLKDFFDRQSAQLIEFDGGHHMPVLLKDSQRLAEMIVQLSE
jgi:pimeloyl-ACP methyl ester carboxylesterase